MIRQFVLSIVSIVMLASPAAADDTETDSVRVIEPWARATPGGATIGAAYLTLQAPPRRGDKLIGASSPAADRVELHNHIKDGDVLRMRQVTSIAVAAGKTVKLQPGGYHVMLFGLKAPLKKDGRLPLTLEFESAGAVKLVVPVMAIGAMQPGSDSQPRGSHGDMQRGSH